MKLRNIIRYTWGKGVQVNGNKYKISDLGEIDVNNQEDIEKLLQNDAWKPVAEKTPVTGKGVVVKEATVKEPPKYEELSKSELINLCRYKHLNFKSSMTKKELTEILKNEG